MSAYGGIVAVNRPVTEAMAEALAPVFTEVVVAPGFEGDSLARLQAKKNLRILEAAPPGPLGLDPADDRRRLPRADARPRAGRPLGVAGRHQGAADRGAVGRPRAGLAGRRPGDVERDRARPGRPGASASAAASRTGATPGASPARRRDGRARGGAYASDAFFPFPDGLDGAIEAGAATVIQPGGSIRDDEVIEAADAAGLAMVFTGERHFRH